MIASMYGEGRIAGLVLAKVSHAQAFSFLGSVYMSTSTEIALAADFFDSVDGWRVVCRRAGGETHQSFAEPRASAWNFRLNLGGSVVPFTHLGIGSVSMRERFLRSKHEEMNMSKNAMAGAVTLCGVGLCLIGGALVMQSGSQAHASAGSMPAAAGSIAAAATAQAGPTVVWYGTAMTSGSSGANASTLLRAWSDGTVEFKKIGPYDLNGCPISPPCSTAWFVVSSPTTGFRAASDSNADEHVDGADLAMLLANWGDAPRVDFPPSDCPLNLINPS